MSLLDTGLKVSRAALMAFTLNLPPYLANVSFVALLVWYENIRGLSNMPIVLLGDVIGFGTGVLLSYFVYSKRRTVRLWGGSNEATRCPHCGGDL